jgi:uncharacterized protein YndB with AHSA1/START domain
VVVTPAQAQHVFEYDYNAPPTVVWEWFNDPLKRGQWMTSEIVPVLRVQGRSGVGARNHCVHGKNQITVEDVLDMRPYDYFTVSHVPQGTSSALFMTFEFQPLDSDKTHFRLLFKAKIASAPEWLNRIICKIVLRLQIFRLWKLESINELIKADGSVQSPSAA